MLPRLRIPAGMRLMMAPRPPMPPPPPKMLLRLLLTPLLDIRARRRSSSTRLRALYCWPMERSTYEEVIRV